MNTVTTSSQALSPARFARTLIVGGALVVALPFVPMAVALFAGVAIALLWGIRWRREPADCPARS